jgi:6-phosphogluconolactonase (cycloisomerase 2 family)
MSENTISNSAWDLTSGAKFDRNLVLCRRKMRMKFNKSGQLLLVSAASLVAAGFLTACTQLTETLTVDFVYVTSAKAAGPNNYGEVDVFEINSQSGHMRQIPTSPFPSGGRNPVAEAVSSDNANLFVVNQDDNTIVNFIIGNDGKLYPKSTVNTPGVFPLAIAVAGSNLYVADTYQPLPTCSPASPCAGSVASYPIGANGVLGTPAVNSSLSAPYWPLIIPGSPKDVVAPTGITASPDGSLVFVTAYDSTAAIGYIFIFSSASGVLTPLNGGVPFPAGIHPSSITRDPSGTYLYVTDLANGEILAFNVNSGTLIPLSGSPFPAGGQPSAMMIDATGKFAAVTNSQDSTVTTYSISSGALTRVGSFTTGLQPVAIGIDPNMNQYIFVANFLGNTVSGFQLEPDGTLLNTQFSPFTANAQPTAVAAIPHNGSK